MIDDNEPGGPMKAVGVLLLLVGIACSFFACAFPGTAHAEGLWLTVTTRSYHADRHAKYNEKNSGIGLEYQFDKDIAAVAGEYKNSFSNKSTYYGVLYTPFSAGPFKAGVLAGNINGYILDEPRKYGFVAVPMIVWEGENVGANMLFVPPIGNGTGVVGFQVKLKF